MTPSPRTPYSGPLVVAVVVGAAMNPLNSTMFAVALAPLSADLALDGPRAAWTIAALYLVSAAGQPLLGTLSDRFDPRWILLVGLALLVAAGGIPLLSPSFGGVLAARILIGIGTSAAYPATLALLAQHARAAGEPVPRRLVTAQSIATLGSAAVGPALGGLLTGIFGWQAIFLVNVPIASAAILIAAIGLRPGDRQAVPRRRPDLGGMGLFAATVSALLLFLLELDLGAWWIAGLAAVAGVALVLWERSREHPFLDVAALARNRPLLRTYARTFLVFLASYLFMFAFPVWLQGARDLSPEAAGLVQLPFALTGVLGAILAGRSARIALPLVLGSAAAIAGGGSLLFVDSATPIVVLVAIGAAFGLVQGLTSVGNQAALFTQATPDRLAQLAGLARTASYIGAVSAAAVVGFAFPTVPTDAGLRDIGVVCMIAGALGLVALASRLRRRA